MEGDVRWHLLPVKMCPHRVTVAGNCSSWMPRAQAKEPVGLQGAGVGPGPGRADGSPFGMLSEAGF